MTKYRLQLFGSTELSGSAGADSLLAQPKRLALLTYLIVAKPRGFFRRDSLVARFWPEFDQEHARAALRKSVHAIRKSLDDDILISRGDEEVGVDRTRIWCDVVAFDEAVADDRLAQALELFQGDLLDGFFADAPEFERWLDMERMRCREQAVDAAWTLAQRYETGEQLTQAARWAKRVIRLATTDERLLRRVMELLARAGDVAGAAQAYQEFSKRLKVELDIEPSSETKSLMQRLKRLG